MRRGHLYVHIAGSGVVAAGIVRSGNFAAGFVTAAGSAATAAGGRFLFLLFQILIDDIASALDVEAPFLVLLDAFLGLRDLVLDLLVVGDIVAVLFHEFLGGVVNLRVAGIVRCGHDEAHRVEYQRRFGAYARRAAGGDRKLADLFRHAAGEFVLMLRVFDFPLQLNDRVRHFLALLEHTIRLVFVEAEIADDACVVMLGSIVRGGFHLAVVADIVADLIVNRIVYVIYGSAALHVLVIQLVQLVDDASGNHGFLGNAGIENVLALVDRLIQANVDQIHHLVGLFIDDLYALKVGGGSHFAVSKTADRDSAANVGLGADS